MSTHRGRGSRRDTGTSLRVRMPNELHQPCAHFQPHVPALAPGPISCASHAMNAIELPWEPWRAVIAALREKGLPYMLEHANVIEEQLKRHGPDEPTVRLSLTDDVFLRSDTW